MNDMAYSVSTYRRPGPEPDLDEVINDPIVRMVMARDGVTMDEIKEVMMLARARLLARRMMEAEGAF